MFRKHRSREKDSRIIVIKEALAEMPEFDLNYPKYERLKIKPEILNEIFFDRNWEPNFRNSEMRKLDLSEIDFTQKNVRGYDYSYTNVNINPQTVLGKDLSNTNLEGVDMSDKEFKGVNIYGTNLKYTGATIDLKTIKGEISDIKKLEGCNIINIERKLK